MRRLGAWLPAVAITLAFVLAACGATIFIPQRERDLPRGAEAWARAILEGDETGTEALTTLDWYVTDGFRGFADELRALQDEQGAAASIEVGPGPSRIGDKRYGECVRITFTDREVVGTAVFVDLGERWQVTEFRQGTGQCGAQATPTPTPAPSAESRSGS